MAVAEAWPRAAADLDPHFERIDIGLHLTLTRLPPLGPMPRLAPEGRLPPLGMLMRLALERRLDRAEVAAEPERQFDAFVTATGRGSEEHTSELQSLMRILYAVFCLIKKILSLLYLLFILFAIAHF